MKKHNSKYLKIPLFKTISFDYILLKDEGWFIDKSFWEVEKSDKINFNDLTLKDEKEIINVIFDYFN